MYLHFLKDRQSLVVPKKICFLIYSTYPLNNSHPWSFYMRIRYIRYILVYFWSPHLSHIIWSTCTLLFLIFTGPLHPRLRTNALRCVCESHNLSLCHNFYLNGYGLWFAKRKYRIDTTGLSTWCPFESQGPRSIS